MSEASQTCCSYNQHLLVAWWPIFALIFKVFVHIKFVVQRFFRNHLNLE